MTTKVTKFNYRIVTPDHIRTKSKDDAILPRSRLPKSPDPFWTKVWGWCNPTTFSSIEVVGSILKKVHGWYNPTMFLRTEVTGSILNKISRMIQSYYVLEYWSHWIHSELKFKDDTILPHSQVPKSSDPFWTKVQRWYNPTTFSNTEVTGSILNKISRMIQSYHILEY